MTRRRVLRTPVLVLLDPAEWKMFNLIGELRQELNVQHGRKDAHQLQTRQTRRHIQGVIADHIVAKYLNIYPNVIAAIENLPENGLTMHYRGKTIKVHSSEHPNLLLNTEDRPEYMHVAVRIISDYEYVIIGWIPGAEGKEWRFWKNNLPRDDAFVVPGEKLYPMRHLKGAS